MDSADADDLESGEPSGYYDLELAGNTGNMTKMENLTATTRPIKDSSLEMENPLLIPMAVVGGVVVFILMTTLICFVYRRKRRQAAIISQRRSKRVIETSDDVGTSQNIVDQTTGFNQALYGYEDEVDQTVLPSAQEIASQPTDNPISLNTATSSNNKKSMPPLYANDLKNSSELQIAGSKTSLSDNRTKGYAAQEMSETPFNLRQKDDEIKLDFNELHKTSLTSELETSNKITGRQENCVAIGLTSKDNAFIGSPVTKDHSDSDINGKNGRTILPPSRCEPELRSASDPEDDIFSAISISKEQRDYDIRMEDDKISHPPPSPCISEHKRDYINIPNDPWVFGVAKKEVDKCEGYVNMSGNTGQDTVSVEQQKYNKKFEFSFESKSVTEASQDDKCEISMIEKTETFNRYVNVPDKLKHPPSYDEVTESDKQCIGFEVSNSTSQNISDYVNMPDTKPNSGIHSSEDTKNIIHDQDKSQTLGNPEKHSFVSKTDRYLRMDLNNDEDNEYLHISDPDAFINYEKCTLSKCFPERKFEKASKSVEELCSHSCVNTRGTAIPQRSSSCDNIYSYADPDIMSSLYYKGDSLYKITTQLKSRTANRSKTLSPADLKIRPKICGAKRIQTAAKCKEETDIHNFGVNMVKEKQKQGMVQTLDSVNTCTAIDDYVNTDIHVPECPKTRNKISRIPVSNRMKNTNFSHSANENNCTKMQKDIIDKVIHDYVNTPNKKSKIPTTTKVNPPAVLPKPTKTFGCSSKILTESNISEENKTRGYKRQFTDDKQQAEANQDKI